MRAVNGHQQVLVNNTVRGAGDRDGADDSWAVSNAVTWLTELSMRHGFVMRCTGNDF